MLYRIHNFVVKLWFHDLLQNLRANIVRQGYYKKYCAVVCRIRTIHSTLTQRKFHTLLCILMLPFLTFLWPQYANLNKIWVYLLNCVDTNLLIGRRLLLLTFTNFSDLLKFLKTSNKSGRLKLTTNNVARLEFGEGKGGMRMSRRTAGTTFNLLPPADFYPSFGYVKPIGIVWRKRGEAEEVERTTIQCLEGRLRGWF